MAFTLQYLAGTKEDAGPPNFRDFAPGRLSEIGCARIARPRISGNLWKSLEIYVFIDPNTLLGGQPWGLGALKVSESESWLLKTAHQTFKKLAGRKISENGSRKQDR